LIAISTLEENLIRSEPTIAEIGVPSQAVLHLQLLGLLFAISTQTILVQGFCRLPIFLCHKMSVMVHPSVLALRQQPPSFPKRERTGKQKDLIRCDKIDKDLKWSRLLLQLPVSYQVP